MDGTFTAAKGGWYQVVTIFLGIRTDNGKEKLMHCLNIHLLDKDTSSYCHAFKKMWQVIERYAPRGKGVDSFICLTDCEFGISKGLGEALNPLGITVINSFCSTHVMRNITKGIKEKTTFRVMPPAVKLAVHFLGSLVRFDIKDNP